MYLPNPFVMSKMRDKFILLSGIQLLRIQTYLSPKLVTLPGLKNRLPNYLLLGGEKRRLHIFRKDITQKWKTDNLFQDLNSGCRFHFLRR